MTAAMLTKGKNMNIKEQFKGIQFFWKGLKAAKTDMWSSLQVLVLATLLLGTILNFVEHRAQPEVFVHWYDSYVWCVMNYLGNPGKFSPGEPITLLGRWIAICISTIKILIFAVPAGLVANGFRAAMSKEKREHELDSIRKRLHKKFNRSNDKSLREYLNSLPDKGGERMKVLNFVPQYRLLSTLQMQMGVSIQDLFDTAKEFPEFRIHNLATAKNLEEDTNDRFVMEHFPVNKSYGYCINRQSDVTIVCTSSFDENGIGWWSYYLALFGGFNYVSKDMEVDMDDIDSFFNMSEGPTFEKKKKTEFKKRDEGYEVIVKKEERRKKFLSDILELTNGHPDSWVFVMCESIKNSTNTADLHLATNNNKNDKPTVKDVETYDKLFNALKSLYDEMNLQCVNTLRYPLLKNNLLYRLQDKEGIKCNGVVMRPSSEFINFDSRSLLIALRTAETIGKSLSVNYGIQDCDLEELKAGYGYKIYYDKRTTNTGMDRQFE